jgi:hypothetical protein
MSRSNTQNEWRSITQNEWNQWNNNEIKRREANRNLTNYRKTINHLYNKLSEMKMRLKSKSPLRRSYHINKRTLNAIQNKINNIEKKQFHAQQILYKTNNNQTNIVKKVYKRLHPNGTNNPYVAGPWFWIQNVRRKTATLMGMNLPENVKKRLPPGVPPHLPLNMRKIIIEKYLNNLRSTP